MSKNYLEAFVILAATFALGFFLVLPKYQEAQAVKVQAEEKIVEIKKRNDYYSALKTIAAQLNLYADNYKKVETALPDDPDAPAVMGFVQTAAMESGLAMKRIAYSETKESSALSLGEENMLFPDAGSLALQEYEISVDLLGTYDSLKNFLSIIERSSRLIAVKKVDVSAKEESKDGEGEEEGQNRQPQSSEKDASEQDDKIIEYEVKLSAHYY